MTLDNLLKNRKLNHEKLLAYGFILSKQQYLYECDILDSQFKLYISISLDGKISDKLIDMQSNDEYILHKTNHTGEYVGKIREEYTHVLLSIQENCFELNPFINKDTQLIIQYIKEKYQDEFEFPWARTPKNAIVRCKHNAKWYALLLTVTKDKIGINAKEEIEIMDLRATPDTIEKLIDYQNYFPGYHMNKKYWFTICLNGSIPIETIYSLIDNSYQIASRK